MSENFVVDGMIEQIRITELAINQRALSISGLRSQLEREEASQRTDVARVGAWREFVTENGGDPDAE